MCGWNYLSIPKLQRLQRQNLGIEELIRDSSHDDVIKWKHFPRNWPFVRGIHQSPVKSPHKDQWRGALMISLICVWINDWVNNREAGDLRRNRTHYDVTVMTHCVVEVIPLKLKHISKRGIRPIPAASVYCNMFAVCIVFLCSVCVLDFI